MLAERRDDPALAVASADELAAELAVGPASALPAVLQSLSRPVRLLRGKDVDPARAVDERLFEGSDERALWSTYLAVRESVHEGIGCKAWLAAVEPIVQPVDSFFTNVFVMADDERVRDNRLAIVRDLARLSSGVLALEELPGF